MTEYLRALANDSRLTAQHVSLFVAITANHLSAGGSFEVDRPLLMKQAKIRRKDTYIALVHDLHEFEYICYEPGHRYKPTLLTVIVPTFTTDELYIIPSSATHGRFISRKNEADETAIAPTVGNNQAGIIPKNETNETEFFIDSQLITGIIPENGNDAGSGQLSSSTSKKKSSKVKNDAAADRAAQRNLVRTTPGRAAPDDVLFADTEFYDLNRFKAAFADDPKFANVDLEHYHEALKDWRDRHTGQSPRRTNWLGTARTFIRNDKAAGKLVTLTVTHDSLQPTTVQSYGPGAIIDRSKYRRDRPGKPGI